MDQVTPSDLQKKARLFVVNETESSQSPGSSELTKKAKMTPAYFDNPEESLASPQPSRLIRKNRELAARKLVDSLSDSPSVIASPRLSSETKTINQNQKPCSYF